MKDIYKDRYAQFLTEFNTVLNIFGNFGFFYFPPSVVI